MSVTCSVCSRTFWFPAVDKRPLYCGVECFKVARVLTGGDEPDIWEEGVQTRGKVLGTGRSLEWAWELGQGWARTWGKHNQAWSRAIRAGRLEKPPWWAPPKPREK